MTSGDVFFSLFCLSEGVWGRDRDGIPTRYDIGPVINGNTWRGGGTDGNVHGKTGGLGYMVCGGGGLDFLWVGRMVSCSFNIYPGKEPRSIYRLCLGWREEIYTMYTRTR
jgi:hypothetical protein